jgi:AcrR family transcriptional regulator
LAAPARRLAAEPVAKAKPGRRARGKAEKLRKITRAARRLFIEKGYDDTTTREIARRAGVGLGTLFTYASDKRDLLFLIFNDELSKVIDAGFGGAPRSAELLNQLEEAFRGFYTFFARQPGLSRFMLRELTFYLDGREARRFQDDRERIVAGVARLVEAAKAKGAIASREDAEIVARAIFAIYGAELRRWLSDERRRPNLAQGMASLRRMLGLLIAGLKPR